jgi:hypothetical protein
MPPPSVSSSSISDSSSDLPDYNLWTAEKYALWPGLVEFHDTLAEKSHWWRFGYRMKDERHAKRIVWICYRCFKRNKPVTSQYTYNASTWSAIERHMNKTHGIQRLTSTADRDSRSLTNMLKIDSTNPYDQATTGQLRRHFDPMANRLLLLDWLTYHNLPFNIVDSDRFQRILLYNNSILQQAQIPSSKTLIRMVDDEYQRAIGSVTEVLRSARGQIHYTFDGWTSRDNTSFLGLNAHFIDNSWTQWDFLLALPPLQGRHTGEALADEVADIITYFGVEDRIGYFTLDNATNNDAAMKSLGYEFGFDSGERRIRCAPHSINLAVRSMLYGNKNDNFEELVEHWQEALNEETDRLDEIVSDIFIDEDDEYGDIQRTIEVQENIPSFSTSTQLDATELAQYRKFGPLGKLHNIGVIMRTSSQIQQEFFKAQISIDPNQVPSSWVHNVCTRWQSDEAMATRALDKRQAINRMLQTIEDNWISRGSVTADYPRILDERLSHQEWHVVVALQRILHPFKVASKQLQGNGIAGRRSTSGGFNEYFPVIEVLLDHLELAVRGKLITEGEGDQFQEIDIFDNLEINTRRLLQVYIRLGWKKMNKYYALMTSSAYVSAVVFHPCHKWPVLDALWSQLPSRQTRSWKEDYSRSIRAIWEAQYKDRVIETGLTNVDGTIGHMSYIQRRLAFTRSTLSPSPAEASSGQQGRRGRRDGDSVAEQDELALYLSEPVVTNSAFEADPLAWWRDVGAVRFPRLSYMAVDFLTIPSSSAESERSFSSTGRMMTPLRSRLKRSFVAKTQCLRSWSKAGIYTPTLPFIGLEEVNWRQVVNTIASDN